MADSKVIFWTSEKGLGYKGFLQIKGMVLNCKWDKLWGDSPLKLRE